MTTERALEAVRGQLAELEAALLASEARTDRILAARRRLDSLEAELIRHRDALATIAADNTAPR